MAKKAGEEAPKTFTFDDFDADNDLLFTPEDTEEDQEDEPEEVEEEKKKPSKKSKIKEEVEDDTEEEEESEEETPKPKKKEKRVETEEEDEESEISDTEEEEETEDDSEDTSKFFEEVEKITGLQVDVDYGDVDPATPQGVAIREKAIRETVLDNFLEEIEANYPLAYKALQHAHNGGNIADLFATTATRDYSSVTIGEKDTALATEILKEYFKSKGIKNETRVNKLIEAAEESEEGLIAEANGVLEELKTEQETKRNELLEDQKKQKAADSKKDQLMVTAVDEVLSNLKLGNFKIASRQEASEFKSFVLKNIRKTTDGRYEVATPLDGNNLEKALQYQYFQFKKGDLDKLIQIKATSENAKKLKLKLKADESKLKRGSGSEEQRTKLSFKDFDAE